MQILQSQKKQVVSICVLCHGVRGKDRKTKFHSQNILDLEPGDVKDSAIEQQARDFLGRNFKSITRAWVNYYNSEICENFKTTHMMPIKRINLIGFTNENGVMQ